MIHMPEVELIVCSVDIHRNAVKVFMRGTEKLDFLRTIIDSDPTDLAKSLFEKSFNTSSGWLSFDNHSLRYTEKLIITYIVTVPEEVTPTVAGEWKNINSIGDNYAELVKRAIRA